MRKITFAVLLAALALHPRGAMADAYDANNYLPTNAGVVLTETNLPILFIDTKALNGTTTVIHKDYRVAVRMTIIDNADGRNYADTLSHPNQTIDYDGWVGIKYRGYSSFLNAKKKPFGFRTLASSDVEGKKQKVKLLGMSKDNNWVLLAPYHDRSMIRDVLTYELARPFFEFTPHARYCELVMDGVYRGVYILCEKPSKGSHRLNLQDPGDEDDAVSGDYLLEVGDKDETDHYYTSKYKSRDTNGYDLLFNNKIYFNYKFPEYDDMMPGHPVQLGYINQRIADMEDALNSWDFADPETGYRRYIDEMSFIDNMLTQEFTGNPDAYRRSTYLYKHHDDIDPRFKVCLWDFNLAYGGSLQEIIDHDTWKFNNKSVLQVIMHTLVPFWWARLMEDNDYVEHLKQRWSVYRQTNYRQSHITHVLDSLVHLLAVGGACERNYQAWPNWDENIYLSLNNTHNYDEEIAYLRSWIDHRISWMDAQLGYDPQSIYSRQRDEDEGTDPQWYDLQGRPIPGRPARKGVYIRAGKLIMKRTND